MCVPSRICLSWISVRYRRVNLIQRSRLRKNRKLDVAVLIRIRFRLFLFTQCRSLPIFFVFSELDPTFLVIVFVFSFSPEGVLLSCEYCEYTPAMICDWSSSAVFFFVACSLRRIGGAVAASASNSARKNAVVINWGMMVEKVEGFLMYRKPVYRIFQYLET